MFGQLLNACEQFLQNSWFYPQYNPQFCTTGIRFKIGVLISSNAIGFGKQRKGFLLL